MSHRPLRYDPENSKRSIPAPDATTGISTLMKAPMSEIFLPTKSLPSSIGYPSSGIPVSDQPELSLSLRQKQRL
jgi:hypothetical protein